MHPSSRLYQATQQVVVAIGPRQYVPGGLGLRRIRLQANQKKAVDIRGEEMVPRIDEHVSTH